MKFFRLIPVMAMISIGFSSCNVTKHLDESKGERLLLSNTLHVKSETKLTYSQRTALSYELSPLYKQKPNSKTWFAFRFRLWLHYRYINRKSKFAAWILNKQAESPVLYDSTLAIRTVSNFENLMRQRGYFKATCYYKTKLIGSKKASVDYHLALGPQYTSHSVEFLSRDTQVLKILQSTEGGSNIKKNGPLDGRLFEAEKLRISAELKNRGYAYFVPQFVQFKGDSSGTRADVRVEVLPFNDSTMHQTYTIGKVEVYTGVVPEVTVLRSDTTINGMYFAGVERKFFVRPDRLYKKIAIRPGMLYNQEEFDKTLRNLNALGVYRFVSVRPTQDSTQDGKINVNINLSPNRRFIPGGDFDFSYSTLNGGLIGVSPSFYFTNHNVFSGAERLRTSVNYNIEFDISAQRFIYAQEFKIQNELAIPRYFDYLGLTGLMHRLKFKGNRVLSDDSFNRLRSEGSARLSANYDYLNVTDFYQFHLLNASFGYNFRPNNHNQYAWDNFGVDVLRPRFADNLTPSKFLQLSFDKQLFTGFVLRTFTYNYASRVNGFGERWNYRLGFEMSGLEVLGANRLWGALFGREDWQVGDLKFSEYLRFDHDLVYTRNFTEGVVGAVRVGLGAGVPFGDSQTVPYVKQFFVGGPSSLRAWRIRELGPGSYVDRDPVTNEIRNIQPYYQAGDFKFEFSGELRFPFISYFKGAVFLDGGNIWTLRYDDGRKGSQLGWEFYKNIALGAGAGIRGDFDYFVIRLDFGLPLRNPYPDPDTKRYWVPNLFSKLQLSDFNPNLAVGYPF
ncbi:MAG: BamA/TamA family outer membrane protein [Saprospiraceae bacterium]|nr:BamA/TamA family outer membrane protein [Saprospiraceae bacterium]